ncbi:MAG: COG1470 family protein [Thermoplasmatota archaeon]
MRRLAGILLALLAVGAGLAAGQPAPESFGVTPRVTVEDAQAGETYLLQVTVQNHLDSESTITVTTQGEGGSWISTDPASGFRMPAQSDRSVQVTVVVPAGAGPGNRTPLLTFTTEPKGGGSQPVSVGASTHVDINVGGNVVAKLTWLDGRAEDALEGQPVPAFVQVRNDGNVRTTAEATGQCLHFEDGDLVLGNATGSLVVLPGEVAEVPLQFTDHLHVGQYRARLGAADGSFQVEDEFKVFGAGERAPDGILRAITHVPYGSVGKPLRLDAWFENVGNVTVNSAAFHGEVQRDGELLATLDSEGLVVPAGAHANLTAYWTPPSAGTYLVTGHVTYDGYKTLGSQSPLNVRASAGGVASWWWILIVLVVLTLLAWLWAWRKGRRDAEKAGRGRR